MNLQEAFNAVIKYSQRETFKHKQEISLDFSKLFDDWENKKNLMISYLPFFAKDRLIYEYPEKITCKVSLKDKKERLKTFIKNIWDYPEIQNFLSENEENFFTNKIIKDYEAPKGIARKGMKIVKSLKLFLDNNDPQLEEIQKEISQIMNQDKMEGTFCVSIHPLDFLSISDNDNNWSSCHSMTSDYRAGNLNYMADPHTLICYVKVGPDRQIKNFPPEVPWNSKAWRTLLFFDKEFDFVMAGRQYPICCDEILEYFQKAHLKAYPRDYNFKFSPWHKEQITEGIHLENALYNFKDKNIPIGNTLAGIKKIYQPGPSALQYNDILLNSDYNKQVRYSYLITLRSPSDAPIRGRLYDNNQYHMVSSLFEDKTYPLIKAGASVLCPICGERNITTSDFIICNKCAIKYYNNDFLLSGEHEISYCNVCDEACFLEEIDYYYDENNDIITMCPECIAKKFPTFKDTTFKI